MQQNLLVFTIFLIFFGAAMLSTIALYTRQSLLVAYILLGVLIGPWGLKLVGNSAIIRASGEIGIIFLLFLLGLNLQPQNLWQMLRKVTLVALISSFIFAGLGYVLARYFGFNQQESLVIGAALMFSSTIIGLKLLPTTVLHHQHTGQLMISVLLMQDLIAIILLLCLHAASVGTIDFMSLGSIVLSLPGMLVFAFMVEKYVLRMLFSRFDRIREYIFLIAIAWCLGLAELAQLAGLSAEIGAFIAGVSIATGPISLYIAESLKPLRDFFLVLFFFSVGASFDLEYFSIVIIPAIILALLLLVIKPIVFRFLLKQVSETKYVAWEVGVRLGQASEFSLLVAYLAKMGNLIRPEASYLIQATTILTFIASSYLVVFRYPTPVAMNDKLRRD